MTRFGGPTVALEPSEVAQLRMGYDREIYDLRVEVAQLREELRKQRRPRWHLVLDALAAISGAVATWLVMR